MGSPDIVDPGDDTEPVLAAPGVFPFDPNTLLKNPGFEALAGAVAFLTLP